MINEFPTWPTNEPRFHGIYNDVSLEIPLYTVTFTPIALFILIIR